MEGGSRATFSFFANPGNFYKEKSATPILTGQRAQDSTFFSHRRNARHFSKNSRQGDRGKRYLQGVRSKYWRSFRGELLIGFSRRMRQKNL
jgi:hypothetical protein